MSNTLSYKIIKSKKQYYTYSKKLEILLNKNLKKQEDEIELLTLLIEKWDEEQFKIPDLNPIEILKALMAENQLKAKDCTAILSLSKGSVSKILNYQKGLSKETIRKLATHFKMTQETFNRPYQLKNTLNRNFKDAALMNTKKKMMPTT